MKRNTLSLVVFTLLIALTSCQKTAQSASDKANTSHTDTATVAKENHTKPTDFIPPGYVLYEKYEGDLNHDRKADCVLIIKGTDKSKWVEDETRGKLDRNRRGIIVLFHQKNGYEMAAKNYSCFSSENEDGGAYYQPELAFSINKGNLYVEYAHGRYGYWSYTFRFAKTDFELIGYDSSDNNGPLVNNQTSINFNTHKKLVKTNVNQDAEGGDEVFKEEWKKIKAQKVRLTEIKDFDELDFSEL